MRSRTFPALIAVLLASGAAVHTPTEEAQLETRGEAQGEALFFSVQIADERGKILAEPMLLGAAGLPLEMSLREGVARAEPRMSLRLQPEARGDGSFEVGFELSVLGRLEGGKGNLLLRSGEERSTLLHYPGGHLELQLTAFAVPSLEFDLFMEHGLLREQRSRRT